MEHEGNIYGAHCGHTKDGVLMTRKRLVLVIAIGWFVLCPRKPHQRTEL
jgi:hypothetical protein